MNDFKAFVFICLLPIAGCSYNTAYHSAFVLIRQNHILEFPLTQESRNFTTNLQYIDSTSHGFPILVVQGNEQIEIYNTKDKCRINFIPLQKEGANAIPGIDGFSLMNEDTLLVFSPSLKTLTLLNSDGRFLKHIHYKCDSEKAMRQVTYGFWRPLILHNRVRIAQSLFNLETHGILTSDLQKKSNLYLDIDLTTNCCEQAVLKYPEEFIGQDISGTKYYYTIGYNGSLVYCFGIDDSLHISDDLLGFRKVPIQANYKFRFVSNYWKFFVSDYNTRLEYLIRCDEPSGLVYDRYRNCYYLVFRQRYDQKSSIFDYRIAFQYPKCLIIILDEEFNHLGELYLPDNTYSFQMMFVAPEGLYISEDHPNNPDFDEDFMRFRLFKLEKL